LKRDRTFADAIEKAESDAEVRFTTIVAEAAAGSWQAAAWWLERRRTRGLRPPRPNRSGRAPPSRTARRGARSERGGDHRRGGPHPPARAGVAESAQGLWSQALTWAALLVARRKHLERAGVRLLTGRCLTSFDGNDPIVVEVKPGPP